MDDRVLLNKPAKKPRNSESLEMDIASDCLGQQEASALPQESPSSFKSIVTNQCNQLPNREENGSWLDTISDDEEDMEEDDPRCLSIHISKEQKIRYQRPWQNAIIIKLLGKNLPMNVLFDRLKRRWCLHGDFLMDDLTNDFYKVTFASQEDLHFVLTEGLWPIFDHYLTIRRWKPNFNPNSEALANLEVLVRFPDLPSEYYNEEFLGILGSKVGKVKKVDLLMAGFGKSRLARVAVEVDLTKPLLAKYRFRRRTMKIEYEGLHLVCFSCGCYGHKDANCPNQDSEILVTQSEGIRLVPEKTAEIPQHIANDYGDWMVPKKWNSFKVSQKKGPANNNHSKMDGGSRFKALDPDSEKQLEDGIQTTKEGAPDARINRDGRATKPRQISPSRAPISSPVSKIPDLISGGVSTSGPDVVNSGVMEVPGSRALVDR